MEMQEMTEIAIQGGWAYGSCAVEMWPQIERAYMNSKLNKRQFTFLYWKHTGLFTQLSDAAYKFCFYKAKMNCVSVRQQAYWGIKQAIEDLSLATNELAEIDAKCLKVCAEANIA